MSNFENTNKRGFDKVLIIAIVSLILALFATYIYKYVSHQADSNSSSPTIQIQKKIPRFILQDNGPDAPFRIYIDTKTGRQYAMSEQGVICEISGLPVGNMEQKK